MLTPGTNIRRLIVEDVIKSILFCWEAIAHCIPTKYEAYSVELLQVITDLWITICGHVLLWKRLDIEVCEQVQERNKRDIETEIVAYINSVTVACNFGLWGHYAFHGHFGRGCSTVRNYNLFASFNIHRLQIMIH